MVGSDVGLSRCPPCSIISLNEGNIWLCGLCAFLVDFWSALHQIDAFLGAFIWGSQNHAFQMKSIFCLLSADFKFFECVHLIRATLWRLLLDPTLLHLVDSYWDSTTTLVWSERDTFIVYPNLIVLLFCSCTNLLCPPGSYSNGPVYEVWRYFWDFLKPWWGDLCRSCSCPTVAEVAGESLQFHVLLLSMLAFLLYVNKTR